jgi:hypothetical protein
VGELSCSVNRAKRLQVLADWRRLYFGLAIVGLVAGGITIMIIYCSSK